MVLRYLPLGLKIQAQLSYAQLDRLSNRFAAALASMGVGKGSRVALILPNLPQQVIAYFGVLKAGAIVVNTNPTYPAHELEPLMRNTGAETVVTLSGLYDRVREIQPRTAIKRIILTDIPEFVSRIFRPIVAKQLRASGMLKAVDPAPDVYWMKDLLAKDHGAPPVVTLDPATDTAVFQFTGGTTGLPKAAELTHRNLMANFAQNSAWVPSLVPNQRKTAVGASCFPCLWYERGHVAVPWSWWRTRRRA